MTTSLPLTNIRTSCAWLCSNRSGCKSFADKLSTSRWSWGCVSAVDSDGQTIWIADAHRDDRKRFVVRADEKLTAFLELHAAIHRRFELRWKVVRELHVLLSAQIKIGHATVWMRTRVCVSFILRPSLLPFGFAPWFARIVRETFAEKSNDAPWSLSV